MLREMGGGCEAWCCEHHPCRTPACPNADTQVELPPLPIQQQLSSAPPFLADTPPTAAAPQNPQPCEPPPAASSQPQPQEERMIPPPPLACELRSSPCRPPSAPALVQPQDDDGGQPSGPPPTAPTPVQPQDVQMDVEEPRPPAEQQPEDVVPPAVAAPAWHPGSGSGLGAPPVHEAGPSYPPPGHRPYPYDYVDPPPRRSRIGEAYYGEEEFGGRDLRPTRTTNYDRDQRPEMGRRPRRDSEDDSWDWLPRGYRPTGGRYASRDFCDLRHPPRRYSEDDSWDWLPHGYRAIGRYASRDFCDLRPPPRDHDDPRRRRWFSFRERASSDAHNDDDDNDHNDEGPGTLVRDNVIVGDPAGVRIGEGNRGGRRTGGRVTGNLVIR